MPPRGRARGLILGDDRAAVVLRAIAEGVSACAEEAAALAAISLDADDALPWITRVREPPGRERAAVRAAGALGDARAIPMLLDALDVPALARIAGEAFTTITAIELRGELVCDAPAGFASGPNDDPDDDDVRADPDGDLAWPQPSAVRAAWSRARGGFAELARYHRGSRVTSDVLRRALADGTQPERAPPRSSSCARRRRPVRRDRAEPQPSARPRGARTRSNRPLEPGRVSAMWDLVNRSRFAVASSFARDGEGAESLLVAIRATFTLDDRGELRVAEEQVPVARVPSYAGDPTRSSLLADVDFAPRKAATDVLLLGHACAVDEKPSIAVEVRARVGAWEKRLVAIGDRRWRRAAVGPRLDDPAPFVRVPLLYEHAYGGAREGEVFDANPIGRGYARRGDDVQIGLAAPQPRRPTRAPLEPSRPALGP